MVPLYSLISKIGPSMLKSYNFGPSIKFLYLQNGESEVENKFFNELSSNFMVFFLGKILVIFWALITTYCHVVS